MSIYQIFKILISVIALTLGTVTASFSQLMVTDTLTDQELVQKLVGPGISVFNVTSTCPLGAKGFFSNGQTTNLGIDEGVVLTTGSILDLPGPNIGTGASLSNNAPGDADLDNVIASTTNDACVLEFDLQVSSDSMTFEYVFGSEEYPEWVNSTGGYNDVFAFFISGPGITGQENIALIPGTTTPVSIFNVNNGNYSCPGPPSGPCTNCSYFIDNCTGTTLEYDGFTTVLTASRGGLNQCATYHLKIAVADVGDNIFDSGVFLEAGSFRTHNFQIETTTTVGSGFNNAVEKCGVEGFFTFRLDKVTNVPVVIHYTIGGTATNGVDYNTIADSIVIAPGDTFEQLIITPAPDGIPEGLESVVLYLINDCNNLPTDSSLIYIQDNIHVTATAPPDTVCEKAEIQLDAEGAYLYLWSPSATLDNASVEDPLASPLVTTTYTVVGAVGACIDSAEVIVYVSDEFLNIDAGLNDTICLNASSQINATVSGNYGPFTYSWTPSKSLNNSTIQDPLAQPEFSTLYNFVVTSSTGCVKEDSVLIEIEGVAPEVSLSAHPLSVCGGDTITATADIISVDCGPTNKPCGNFGTATVGTGTVTSEYPFRGFWESSRSQFLFLASELNPLGMDYVKITDLVFNLTTKSSSHLYQDFNIKVGCTDVTQLTTFIDSLTLVYNNPSYSTVAGNNTFTFNTPYAWDGLSNLVIEFCYTSPDWSDDDFVAASVTPFNSVVFDFASFGSGCGLDFPGISTERPNMSFVYCDLTYPNLTYQWDSKNGTIYSSIDSALIIVDSKETIELTVWDANCPNTVGVEIEVDSLFKLNAGADTMICPLELVPLDVKVIGTSGNNLSYNWFPAGLVNNPSNPSTNSVPLAQNTNFIIEANSPAGCSDKDTLIVVVDSAFNVDAGSDVLICEYDDVQLVASIIGRSDFDFNYKWTPSTGLSDDDIKDPSADPSFPGLTYYLEATSPIGCIKRDSIFVEIDTVFAVNTGQDKTICKIDTVQLLGSVNGRSGANMTYFWAPSSELNNSTISDPVATPTAPSSTYSLTVTSPAGCEYSNDIIVSLSNLMTDPFFTDTLITGGSSIDIGATVTGGSGNYSFNWFPDINLGSSTSLVTTASPDSTQLYILHIHDMNGGMCNDTIEVRIGVEDIDTFFVTPNAFTPNGDNLNNTFYPLLRDPNSLTVTAFQIYNRWGDLVHDDALTPWDGNHKGERLPVGSYVYVFELHFPDESRKTFYGNITLLR